MVNYVLIGFSASGKTTVGQLLAEKTGYRYISTDAMVEQKVGMDCGKIIQTKGKDYFSALEKEVIQNLANEKEVIVDIGSGGAYRNPKEAKQLGKIIFLKVDSNKISERILDTEYKRNYITNVRGISEKDHEAYISEKLKAREPIYLDIADLVIDTNNKKPDEIVKIILNKSPISQK